MNDARVLIIIPAFNEEANIQQTYMNIKQYNQRNSLNLDVIIIDDGSTDRTSILCAENNIPTINLIHNLGIGGAVQTGYKYALSHNYDIAVQFDGDGQHDINYVQKLINPIIRNEADFVIGSRFIDDTVSGFKSSKSRRIGINIISAFIKLFTGTKIYDTTSGFRACNKKLIKHFAYSYPLEYPEPITAMELIKNNFRIKEVAVEMKERTGGKSSIHSWKNIYYMMNVLISVIMVGIRRENRNGK